MNSENLSCFDCGKTRKMQRENARLRAALAPFADYGAKHGSRNLCGTNGAYLSTEAWIEAHAAFHGMPNAKAERPPDNLNDSTP